MAYSAITFGATTADQTANTQTINGYVQRLQAAQLYLNQLISKGLDANTARVLQTTVTNVGSELNLLNVTSDQTQFNQADADLTAAENAISAADTPSALISPGGILKWGLLAVALGGGFALYVISRGRRRR